MRKMLLATATALSMAAVPALAQTSTIDDKRDFTPQEQAIYDSFDTETRTMFDTWPAEQQMSYFAWPAEVQTYYWTLDADQQDAWWYLDDTQRMQIYGITDTAQRDATWQSITDQVAQMESGTTMSQQSGMMGSQQATRSMRNTQSASASEMRFVSNEMVQDMPASSRAPDAEYPICESDSDDNCINAWEAGRRGPGVDRPLGYWPEKS